MNSPNRAVNRALIGLGSNLPFEGLRGPALLEEALGALGRAGLRPIAVSSVWRSAAWPDPSQPAFFNAVAALDARDRGPEEVYAQLAATEVLFGRLRGSERWGARTLDLDLLDQGGRVAERNGIEIPHPRLSFRRFVLVPLQEIDPKWVHPVSRLDLNALLNAAEDDGTLQRIGPLRIAPGAAAD